MFYYERKFKKQGYDSIIGVDEVGRGPLAGPVVAAAVMLKDTRFRNRIDDSKQLSAIERENAYQELINKSLFGVGIVNEKIIDRLNIEIATQIAMQQAIQILINKLSSSVKAHILIDGNVKPDIQFPYTNIIRGDSKSKSIAAASILAKVTRDGIMDSYNELYPEYGFSQHKGYPTRLHRDALNKFGPSVIHRMSFGPVREKLRGG